MYKFAVGEVVTVLSKELIAQSLDSENKTESCIFMDQMEKYCGQNYKILKTVKNSFNYGNRKLIGSRGPIYILDNLMCDGEVGLFDHLCDKSCYLLWHQDWLKKA
jgi:hypothetical protein